ncbi:UNVERIFIED_CONTAM: hypothetical protein HDU68_010563 [Siphonaria sp. JEL0065]|nr:hypothetical protein HDU68_010563 [Siphonaria sp. JEL0065]
MNDLPQDEYVQAIRDEILHIMASADSRKDVHGWIEPIGLNEMRLSHAKLNQLTDPAINEARNRGSEDSDDSERKNWISGVKGTIEQFIGSVL